MEEGSDLSHRRFEVVSLLGKGACGSVYHVKDLQNGGRDLALKVLDKSPLFSCFNRDRFVKEILILSSIKHRNIVSAYEVVTFDNKTGYTMELVIGKDLGTIIDDPAISDFSLSEISSIIRQLLLAVGELHKHEIIHRDIKLDNVMLREDGVVKLNDLGLAKILTDLPRTDPGLILGTAHYMSPEYILNKSIDGRADIYACGMIMWELMHGKRRFVENSEKVLRELMENNFKHPIPVVTAENEWFVRILKKSLAPEVKDRFQTTQDMIDALNGSFDLSELSGNSLGRNLVCYLIYLTAGLLVALLTYLLLQNHGGKFF